MQSAPSFCLSGAKRRRRRRGDKTRGGGIRIEKKEDQEVGPMLFFGPWAKFCRPNMNGGCGLFFNVLCHVPHICTDET